MMKTHLQIYFGLIVLLFSISSANGEQTKSYLSPDKILAVKVISNGKTHESRIEIHGSKGNLLLKKDFASKDGEHGLVVEHAGWTPDGQFFVFSTYNSGGHQPWQAPTFFYSRQHNKIHDLDEYLTPIAESDFVLKAPDEITVTIWTPFRNGTTDSIMLPITFRLSNLFKKTE